MTSKIETPRSRSMTSWRRPSGAVVQHDERAGTPALPGGVRQGDGHEQRRAESNRAEIAGGREAKEQAAEREQPQAPDREEP